MKEPNSEAIIKNAAGFTLTQQRLEAELKRLCSEDRTTLELAQAIMDSFLGGLFVLKDFEYIVDAQGNKLEVSKLSKSLEESARITFRRLTGTIYIGEGTRQAYFRLEKQKEVIPSTEGLEKKWIPGFGNYFAGSNGEIYNHKGTRLTPHLDDDGYRKVGVKDDAGKFCSKKVSVLVCIAFLGQRPEGTTVRHIDGKNWNDVSSNLDWGTSEEQEADKRRHGTAACARGDSHHWVKLNSLKKEKLRQLLASGLDLQSVAKECNISVRTVSRFIRAERSKS